MKNKDKNSPREQNLYFHCYTVILTSSQRKHFLFVFQHSSTQLPKKNPKQMK